jgi:hypothetical protein
LTSARLTEETEVVEVELNKKFYQSETTLLQIEHHFEKKDILPVKEQIDFKVMISKQKAKADFIIEPEADGLVQIEAGSTAIKVKKEVFEREVGRYLLRR